MRVQARLKALYQASGIATPGKNIYGAKERDRRLKRLPASSRWATEKLREKYYVLLELKQQADHELVAEPRKHRVSRIPFIAP